MEPSLLCDFCAMSLVCCEIFVVIFFFAVIFLCCEISQLWIFFLWAFFVVIFFVVLCCGQFFYREPSSLWDFFAVLLVCCDSCSLWNFYAVIFFAVNRLRCVIFFSGFSSLWDFFDAKHFSRLSGCECTSWLWFFLLWFFFAVKLLCCNSSLVVNLFFLVFFFSEAHLSSPQLISAHFNSCSVHPSSCSLRFSLAGDVGSSGGCENEH